MEHFKQVDPTGQYLDFLQQAKKGSGGLLWIYGSGDNGKTCLNLAIQNAYPKETFIAPLEYQDYPGDLSKSFCTWIYQDPDLPDKVIIESLAKYQTQYPQTAFVVEANQPPPSELECKIVHCPNFYSDPNFKPNIIDIRNVICIQ